MLGRFVKLIFLGSFLAPVVTSFKPSAASCHDLNGECGNEPQWNPCSMDFDLIQGTASTATTLWLLGVRHSLQDKTVSCIEHLTEKHENHRIYLESFPPGKVSCKKAGIKEKAGRECVGWDDMDAENAAASLSDSRIEVGVFALQNIYTQQHLSDSFMDKYLQKISKSHLEEKEAANLLLEQRKSGDSYLKIFARKDTFVGTELTPSQVKKMKSYNKKRNQSLLKVLNDSPPNLFKVVSIGKAHVVKHEGDIGEADYLARELQKGKHQNYYAVLAV